MRDRGPGVDIGTCYREYGRVRSSLRRRPPRRRHPADRKAVGWWGLTVTDDHCLESNTYTHWTGRQSIVPWKHLRNIPRVLSRARACYYGLLHASNSTPQLPRIHREMSRIYLPTTPVAPFIAADILTLPPLPPIPLALAYVTRALRMLAFFMKTRTEARLLAHRGSRVTFRRMEMRAIHDARWYFGRPNAFRPDMVIIPARLNGYIWGGKKKYVLHTRAMIQPVRAFGRRV